MNRVVKVTAFRVSLLVTLGMCVLYLGTARSILGRNLETKTLDFRFRLRGVQSPESPVVLVAIDDRSISELGRWPWSRSRFAEIVHRLKAAGARVIVFEVLFLEPEVNAAREMLQRVSKTAQATLPAPLVPHWETLRQALMSMPEAADPDQQFARALHEAGNVVLALSFDFSPSPRSPTSTPPPAFVNRSAYRSLQFVLPGTTARLPHAMHILPPISKLGQQARALGHVLATADSDGTLRYDYPVVDFQGAYYPSLALQVVRLYRGLAPEEVKIQFGLGFQLGTQFIPTDESMRLLVNYYGPTGTFPTYSFIDVLHARLPDTVFQDKIVLIGGTAAGVSARFVTPFSSALPGLEKQASVMTNILQSDFLRRRETTALVDLSCILTMGLLVGWLSPRWTPLWSHLIALGLGGLYVAVNYLVFARAGVWLNLIFPLLTVVSTQGSVTLHQALTEERQKRRLRRAFQHYVHPAVVEQVVRYPQHLKLGGEERELTVLFSDVRDFSRISEQLTPANLLHLLNDYLTAMTQLVLDDHGLLDKYIGDAIMAVYGAPLPLTDHAYRACCTALNMLTTLRALQHRWQTQGLPALNIGIGINTGTMVVGNMGSMQHFNYTVMGDAVNIASRLEGANKAYGTYIIINESTWQQVKDRLATRELDIVRVTGKDIPTRIFEVLGFQPLPPTLVSLVQCFESALHAYRARQWDKAQDLFQQALHHVPHDMPSQLYVQRCELFQATPPPVNWDGVFMMHSK